MPFKEAPLKVILISLRKKKDKEKMKNMQTIRKLRRSIKAISPIISVLLLIAIAVVASLVVYAWVMGYIGSGTTKAGYAINIQSFSSNQTSGDLTIYVQNVGQGAVQLNPASAVYINNTLVSIISPAAGTNGLITIPQGQTLALVVDWPHSGPVTIKIVTTSGTFMTTSGTSIAGAGGATYTVTFGTSGGGGSSTTSPNGSNTYTAGKQVGISATPATGYTFSGWTHTGLITVANASSASTTATVNSAGTVTATFSQSDYSVVFATSGTGTTSPTGTGSYTFGQQVSISATAGTGYQFSGWSASGSITFANAASASTTMTVNGAGTVTAAFTQITYQVVFATSGTGTTSPTGTNTYNAGQQVSITATAGTDYGFSVWSTSGLITFADASSASTTATVNGAGTITANFVSVPTLTTITISPLTSSIAPGGSQTYAATGFDQNGNNMGAVTSSATFSVNGVPIAGGGNSVTETSVGSYSVTASVGSVTSNTATLTVFGALAKFSFSTISSPQTAGTAFPITITAQDANGYTVANYAGPATLTDLGSLSTTTGAFTGGVWTGQVTITTALANDAITATDPTSKSTGQSSLFAVNVGSATILVVSGFPSPVAAGTAGSVTVTAEDAYGNVATGYTGTVAITSSDAKAVLPSSATLTNGVGSFTVTLNTVGSQSITATDTAISSITGSQTGITVNAGALASFVFGAISSPQTAGTAFSITITAYDSSGNVETNYAGPAVLSDSSGLLSPTSTGAFTNGVCTVSVTITKALSNDVITVTDTSGGTPVNAQSSPFTVSPGPLASFTISAISSPQTAGTAFSITITAYDGLGNVETNYVGPATLSDVSGSLSPTSAAFIAGVYTGSVKIATANSNDAITVTGTLGIKTVSNTFNVVAGSIDHFVFNTISSPQTAGTAFSVTITAKDTSGNTVTGYTGSASFTDLSGSISLKSTGVFTNGVLTATVEITKAFTSDTINATDTTTGAKGTSNSFNVVAAPATQLVYIAGKAQSITTSTVSSVITVQLQDSNGNPVLAGTSGVTVNLGTSTTTGAFWSNSAGTTKITSITIPSGSSSASFYYSDTAAGSPILTASSTGLTSATTTFTINSYVLTFSSGAGQSLAPGQLSQGIVVSRTDDLLGDLLSTITVQLTSSSSTGKFYNSAGTQITSITINILSTTSATFYYSDTTAGTPILTASSSGYTPGTTTFTIYTATLNHFSFSTIANNQASGTAFSITITAIDQNGNTYTGYTGTNTLTLSGTGTISPTPTPAFVAGVWTGSVTITTTLTSISISTSGGGAAGTSNTFTVYTPTLSSFSFSSISGTKTAGTSFSVTITAKDQDGNTMTSYASSATLTETGGGAGTGASVSPSSVTFTNGVYTGNVYVTKSGSGVTITATSGTASTASGTFTVSPGAAVSITVSPATDSVTAGNTVTYTATATDTYGNTFSDTNSVTWSISSGAGGSWSNNVYTSHTAGTWTVTANAGGGVTGTATLTVTAGTLYQFVFGSIGTQETGKAFTVTITQEDRYGNIVTTNGGTPTLEVSHGSVSSSGWVFSNGVWTGQVTVTESSTRTVSLYVNNYQNEQNSGTFTVNYP